MKTNTQGLFSNRILELLNHSFSGLYHRVHKGYWHNSMFARMSRNYVKTNWQNGTYEVYIPTFEHVEQNMNYYRVIVKVVPELDTQIFKTESAILEDPLHTPMGVVDSETKFVVASHRTLEAQQQKQFIRGKRVRAGHMNCAIISSVPEICVKRILVLVANFLKQRIRALLNTFCLKERYFGEENVLYYKHRSILENVSYSLNNTLCCLSKTLYWLFSKTKLVFREIGRQNIMKTIIKQVFSIKKMLREANQLTPHYFRGGTLPPELTQICVGDGS